MLLLATSIAYTVSARKFTKKGARPRLAAPHNAPAAFCNTAETPGGDLVYMSECKENEVTYGVISIRLKQAYTKLADAEQVLSRFMRCLQPGFGIQHTTRGGVNGDERETSITDYWQCIEQKDWKVKGWTNGRDLSVVYVKNIGQLPVDREEKFLNGFRFIPA